MMRLAIPMGAALVTIMLIGPNLAHSQVAGPAELPPATFSDAQYVDSQGCVFIRANVDGVTVWAPRVNRARQPVCGFRPSLAAVTESAPTQTASTPTAPAQSLPIPMPEPDVVPALDVAEPAPPPPAPPAATRRVTQPQVTPARATSRAQPKPSRQASATRYIPRHVYEQRAGSADITVPKGYKPVWSDGRLNPDRAITTDAPAQARTATIPPGYRAVFTDGRLNTQRGVGTDVGATRMAQVWTNEVPRRLVPAVVPEPVTDVSGRILQSPDTLLRAKTETASSAPAQSTTQAKPRYIRAAAYGTEAEARQAASQLASASGLPAKAGFVRKGGTDYPAVLVGPFQSDANARTALSTVRQAGFKKARVLR